MFSSPASSSSSVAVKRSSTERPVVVSSSERAVLVSSSDEVLRHMRFSHSAVGRGSRSPRRASGSSPDRLTAIVTSALTAATGAIGIGSRMPPSASSRPSSTCGRDETRNGDGCPDRVVDRAALHPDRLAGDQVGGHRREGHRQFLDGDVAENLADGLEDPLRAQHAGRGDRRIEESQHRALCQRACPQGVFIELACGFQPADQCAHRGTGDAHDLVAPFAQLVDHADVRVATCAAATQRQCHPHGVILLCPDNAYRRNR